MSIKFDLSLIKTCIEVMDIDFCDTNKTCAEFNMFINDLYQDGEISDNTYNNTYLKFDKKKKKVYLCCRSYSIRIM